MGITVLVLYPKTDDSKFDMNYYKDSHMPMVAQEFANYGFKGYRIVSLISNVDQSPSQYSTQCSLEFDTADNVKKALTERGEKVLGDVPNFSNKDPVLIVGDEVDNTVRS